MKYRKIFIISITLIFVLEIIYLLVSCSSREPILDEELRKLTDDDYVGSQTCQSCHPQEFSEWQFSHHDQAMMEADDHSVKGDFNTTFASQGVTSRFYKKGGKYYVNTEGADGNYHDYEVVYTYGISPLQQYIVKFPDGKLQCLRTAWDVEKNEWFDLYPNDSIDAGEWIHWTGGGLNWNTMCSDCHSTNVHKNFDEASEIFNTTFSIINVACEACHGPGKKHVDWVSSPDYNGTGYGEKVQLYLTSSLTSKQQVDQCARCHSRRVQHTEAFNHEGEYMDHYTPEILRDNIYFPDGQIRDEVYVYGSFVQSKMYQNGVKCTDCHNPHSLELKAIGNALCSQCHVKEKYDTPDHHFHAINTEGSACVSCHMPGRTYMGNDFRRDHSFRVPRPDLSVIYNTPNACNQCHEDRSAAWAAESIKELFGPERKFHYSEVLTEASTGSGSAIPKLIDLSEDGTQPAIVRATAIWYLDQTISQESKAAIIRSLKSNENIVRHTAATLLGDLEPVEKLRYLAPLLNDKVRTVRIAAASAMADVPKEQMKPEVQTGFDKAIKEYQASLAVRADFPGGQFEKGQYYERKEEFHLAEQAYLKAIKFDNHFNAARLNLAHLYNRLQKNDKAIELFKTVIQQEPGYGGAYYSLGLLYAEENRMEYAAEYLSKAAELDDNPRIFYNLGIVYQQLDQPDQAEKTYLKGLQLDSSNLDLSYALGVLYVQQDQLEMAKPHIEKLLRAYPENQQLKQLWMLIVSGRP